MELVLNVMRQSTCLVLITMLHSLIAVGGSGVRLYDGPDLKQFILIGLDLSFFDCCLAHQDSSGYSRSLQISSGVV